MENWINDIRKRFERHQQEPPKGLLGDIKAEMLRRGLASTTSSALAQLQRFANGGLQQPVLVA